MATMFLPCSAHENCAWGRGWRYEEVTGDDEGHSKGFRTQRAAHTYAEKRQGRRICGYFAQPSGALGIAGKEGSRPVALLVNDWVHIRAKAPATPKEGSR